VPIEECDPRQLLLYELEIKLANFHVHSSLRLRDQPIQKLPPIQASAVTKIVGQRGARPGVPRDSNEAVVKRIE